MEWICWMNLQKTCVLFLSKFWFWAWLPAMFELHCTGGWFKQIFKHIEAFHAEADQLCFRGQERLGFWAWKLQCPCQKWLYTSIHTEPYVETVQGRFFPILFVSFTQGLVFPAPLLLHLWGYFWQCLRKNVQLWFLHIDVNGHSSWIHMKKRIVLPNAQTQQIKCTLNLNIVYIPIL